MYSGEIETRAYERQKKEGILMSSEVWERLRGLSEGNYEVEVSKY